MQHCHVRAVAAHVRRFQATIRTFFNGVKYKILTAATTRSTISWQLTPCSMARNFTDVSEEYCLDRQSPRVSGVSKLQMKSLPFFLIGLLFYPENEGSKFLRNADASVSDYTALHP
jgi:hypothetical protein